MTASNSIQHYHLEHYILHHDDWLRVVKVRATSTLKVSFLDMNELFLNEKHYKFSTMIYRGLCAGEQFTEACNSSHQLQGLTEIVDFFRKWMPFIHKGGVVYHRKKKGGGSVRFQHSARCASKWRRPVEADFAIVRLTAQSRHRICIFLQTWLQKLLENAGNAKKKQKSDPKSPGEKQKKRPKVVW